MLSDMPEQNTTDAPFEKAGVALTIKVDIVSAQQTLFSGSAKMVFATGMMGELGITPNHAPLLTLLRPGQVRLLLPNDEEMVFYTSGGILEIQPYVVTVLADTAVRAEDIDEAAALEARERVEKALKDRSAEIDYSTALAELAQAAAQIRAIQELRKKGKTSH